MTQTTKSQLAICIIFMTALVLTACGASQRQATPPQTTGADTSTQRLPEVGFCDVAQIKYRLNDQSKNIGACYEEALKHMPKLQGKLVVMLYVDVDGKPGMDEAGNPLTHIALSNIKAPAFHACILNTIQSLTFHKPQGGMCSLKFPLLFSRE